MQTQILEAPRRPGKTTTFMMDLSIEPQPRKILAHLQSRGSISPMEALTSYGISRLAPAINELRKAGYDITTVMKRDEVGHQYARYSYQGRTN